MTTKPKKQPTTDLNCIGGRVFLQVAQLRTMKNIQTENFPKATKTVHWGINAVHGIRNEDNRQTKAAPSSLAMATKGFLKNIDGARRPAKEKKIEMIKNKASRLSPCLHKIAEDAISHANAKTNSKGQVTEKQAEMQIRTLKTLACQYGCLVAPLKNAQSKRIIPAIRINEKTNKIFHKECSKTKTQYTLKNRLPANPNTSKVFVRTNVLHKGKKKENPKGKHKYEFKSQSYYEFVDQDMKDTVSKLFLIHFRIINVKLIKELEEKGVPYTEILRQTNEDTLKRWNKLLNMFAKHTKEARALWDNDLSPERFIELFLRMVEYVKEKLQLSTTLSFRGLVDAFYGNYDNYHKDQLRKALSVVLAA